MPLVRRDDRDPVCDGYDRHREPQNSGWSLAGLISSSMPIIQTGGASKVRTDHDSSCHASHGARQRSGISAA